MLDYPRNLLTGHWPSDILKQKKYLREPPMSPRTFETEADEYVMELSTLGNGLNYYNGYSGFGIRLSLGVDIASASARETR